MADLFEDSGSDGDIADTFNSSPVTATNGYGYGEKDEPSPTWNGESEVKRKDVPSGHGGEEEEEEVSKGPRDEIRLTVVEFQRTADDFTYDIMVEVNGKKQTIHRNYKDLLWLHRNLTRRVELGGNILPPMPPPPPKGVDPKVLVLGQTSKALYGDYNRLPCLAMETFLQALADHRFFSVNNTVHDYLVQQQVENEEKLGIGTLWSSFTKVISDIQKGKTQDPEEEFSKFLKTVEDLAPKLQEAAKTFANLVSTQQSLAVSEFLLAEMLKEHANWSKDKNASASSIIKTVASGLDEERDFIVSSAFDGRHTLGFTFELYHAYCTQAKDMLYRRLSKLQTLLSCTSQLDKAKPEKKEAARTSKNEADRIYRSITDIAKGEIEVYMAQYTSTFRGNLIGYAEAQLQHSKRTYSNLAKLHDALTNTVIDQP